MSPHHFPVRGPRAQVLLILGLIWIMQGVGLLTPSGEALGWVHIPLLSGHEHWRAAGWIATGAVGVLFALRPRAIANDGIAFAALYVMPAYRLLAYTLAWLDSLLPLGGHGYSRGWLSALVYLALVRLIVICAGWSDPMPHPREKP